MDSWETFGTPPDDSKNVNTLFYFYVFRIIYYFIYHLYIASALRSPA